jgi:CBS-domain-containing membrane protein
MITSIAPGHQPIQRIYRGPGTQVEQPLSCADPDPGLARVPTIADQVPVTQIMSREVTCARRDLEATFLVDLMVRNRIGCVPIVEEPGRPVGMVTKLDLVEQLLATGPEAPDRPSSRDPMPRTANSLMMPLAIALGEHATVAHAAALMASEDVHHIPIIDGSGRLIGIISTMDIVRWLARNDGFNTP